MTFAPTVAKDGTPTTCYCCARAAAPVGIGDAREPKYLCQQCLDIVADIKRVQRFSPYELRAVGDAGDEAGGLLDKWGKTDLAELSEEEWRVFLRTVIDGFGRSLRKHIAEGAAPF